MIIQASNTGMHSQRSYESTTSHTAAFASWGTKSLFKAPASLSGSANADTDSSGNAKNFNASMSDLLKHFDQTKSIQAAKMEEQRTTLRKVRFHSMDYLLALLFGEKYRLSDSGLTLSGNSTGLSGTAAQLPGGFYSSASYYHEAETTSFSTTGTVVTADGRTLEFGIDLTMTRSFTEAYSESFQFGSPQMTDPLVLNLDGSPASVSDQKFLFDLDADGHAEMISMLGSGSGFLALDKNGDGIINDGNELFGTKSGDGFMDLASYDEDGNGWIDEADSIFDKLMIWTKDADGTDRLCGLGAAGVGAIYLDHVSTDFSLNSATDNRTNGAIRQTGIFLYENGTAGTVQHLDLAR